METSQDLHFLSFDTPQAWRDWLDQHHTSSPGLWLRIFKKGSGQPTVTYAEALDEALCYGWIDSTKRSCDAASFLQRFSPRKSRSIWSQVNREQVARLIEAGKMQPAGQAAIDAAKQNGQWDAAYESPSQATIPADFQAALDEAPAAKAFFDTLTKQNRYSFLYRIQTAKKPETRLKRIQWAIDMLSRQETPH